MTTQRTPRKTAPATDDAGATRRATGGSAAKDAPDATRPEFVGRDDTLTAVVEALQHGPALVLIEGEAGIGKTRLLRETLMAIKGPTSTEDGLSGPRRVLVAACPALKDPFPLGAVVDGLRRLVRSHSGTSIGELGLSALGLSPLCGALRPLFPEWADDLPPALEGLDDPKETRHRLFRALTELVEQLDVDVLVVEDVHWADTATLEWLLTLTAADPVPDEAAPGELVPGKLAPGEIGRSIVISYRPTDVPEGSLLLRLTSRPPAGMTQLRVTLEPLDVEQTRTLVASMFHTGEVSEQFAEFLHERTDGVPLAVEECVRLLRDRKDIVRQSGQWSRRALENLEVPPTVRDSVLERVERLHPDVRAVLHAAAVLGAPSDERLLTTVAGLDEQAAQLAVTAALASGLLQETGPSRFVLRHVLDAQAIAESIQPSDWRRMHGRAAAVLQGLDPEPAVRLARHFREAGETEAWCHFAEASADLAWESGDDAAVVTILLDLLATVDHPVDRRAKLMLKLGDAAFFGRASLGDLSHQVVDALRTVLNANGLPQNDRGELRLHLGRMLWDIGDTLASFEEMEAAIPNLADRPDLAIRAMTNLAMPLMPDWPATRHLKWLDRATELIEQSGSSSDRLLLITRRATTLLLLGDEAGWTAAEEIPVSASGLTEQRLVDRELLNVAHATMPWGRYENTQRLLNVAVGHIKSSEYQRRLSTARLTREYLDWYTGAWQGLGAAALEIVNSEEGEPVKQLQASQLLGLLEMVAGAKAADRRLREVADAFTRLGAFEPATVLAPAALGRLRLTDDAAEAALSETTPVVEMITRKNVWLWATDVLPVHLDALVGVDELGQAETVVCQFAEGIAGRNAPAPAAALLLCRGIVAEAQAEPVRAATLFAEAASAWAALPRPYDELLALERQGRCLLTAGESERALALLSDVQEHLRALGAKWDADRVAHLLRQHGVEVPTLWRGGRRGYGDQLSPRELEVVELVARGMSNPQVAEALFLSRKTVERHVRAAMRKLNVSSRTALAMSAADAGLLSPESETDVR